VQVPFTHTAKSSGTIFVALFSLVWLGERLERASWVCIALLIGGIALATSTEVHFSLIGFLAAVAAAFFQSLNVVASKLLLREGYDKTEVYFQGMQYAFVIFLPLWLWLEAPQLVSSGAMETATWSTVFTVIGSGACLYWQEASGFLFLTLVGPVTHAMGNGLRSVAVIAYGAWYFSTPVDACNASGWTIAAGAVMAHSYLGKRAKPKAD